MQHTKIRKLDIEIDQILVSRPGAVALEIWAGQRRVLPGHQAKLLGSREVC